MRDTGTGSAAACLSGMLRREVGDHLSCPRARFHIGLETDNRPAAEKKEKKQGCCFFLEFRRTEADECNDPLLCVRD